MVAKRSTQQEYYIRRKLSEEIFTMIFARLKSDLKMFESIEIDEAFKSFTDNTNSLGTILIHANKFTDIHYECLTESIHAFRDKIRFDIVFKSDASKLCVVLTIKMYKDEVEEINKYYKNKSFN